MRLTVLLDAVINVDPAWKMKTALGSPCASRVTVPVRPMEPAVLYTPATSVWPPRSGVQRWRDRDPQHRYMP
jgi:hypothetical protein